MVGGIENRGESMPKTPQESPAQPESQGGRGGHQGAQDGGANRADVWRPSDPGRGLEETSAGRFARHLRQRPRAGAPAVRRRKDELYKQIGQLKVELDFLKKRAGLID